MLNAILNLPELIGRYVLISVVTVVNFVIAALGAVIGTLFALLPQMPEPPGPPDSGVLAWFSWVYPVGGVLALLVIFVAAYVTLLVIRIGLRWVKAL